jgi:hypothetical protein
VDRVFDELNILDQGNSDVLYDLLKGISDMYKKHGTLLSDNWKWFVNLETLGGYLPAKDPKDFDSDLSYWVTGDIAHEMFDGDEMSEDLFLDTMRDGLKDFFRPTNLDSEAYTIDQFADRPDLWGVGGSSSRKDRRAEYTSNGRTYKVKKTKWSTALMMTPAEVRQILTTVDAAELRGRAKAIQKRETGKVRAVVTSEDETYIRMSYISSWMEGTFRGDTRSTLFMTSDQLVDMWRDLSRTIGSDIRVPLDQSHFDHQQTKRMFEVFFDVLDEYISTWCVNPAAKEDLLHVSGNLRQSMIYIPSVLQGFEQVFLIEKGILSGWRWTAFLDTAFNWAEMYCAKRQLDILGYESTTLSLVAQGDDDQVSTRNYATAASLTVAYRIMNFEINPGKFFIDRYRDEYLRQVVTEDEVSGYPARGINAVLWRGPETRDPPAGETRIRESFKAWMTLHNRGCDFDTCYKNFLVDASQGNGFSKAEIDNLVHTPSTLGGLGLMPYYGNSRLTEVSSTRVFDIVSELPGLQSLVKRIPDWAPVDQEDIDAKVRSMLDASNADWDHKGELEIIETRKLDPLFFPFGSGSSLRAGYQDWLKDQFFAEEIVKGYIKRKEWDKIHLEVVSGDEYTLSKNIERKGGRRVWLDWITGKLPFKVPYIQGYSDLQVGVEYEMFVKSGWSWLTTRPRFNMTNVMRVSIGAEILAYRNLRDGRFRHGG